MEPENNIETILQGFVNSNTFRKFIVVGNTSMQIWFIHYKKI